MRVITTPEARSAGAAMPARHAARHANVELLGLLAGSLVIALGLGLTYWGRIQQLGADERSGRLVNLQRLRGPEDLVPLLDMFESSHEKGTVAQALYRRPLAVSPKIDHVGALAGVSLPAADVRADKKLPRLRNRLDRRPDAAEVAALTPADIAAIKPHVAVRTVGEFRARVLRAAALFFGAFWLAHLVRRWRRVPDDPMLLPAVLMLSGIGMISMLALRDPLRDTVTASTFAGGVAGGLVLLLAASEIDFEASRLRRSVLAPLSLALGLAALLLIFGTGPGASGVKVNLFGFQPVEVIRLLVVFALAAHFAGRLEFLREFSERPAPSHPWLRHIRVPRWKDVRPVVISMLLVLAFFFLQKDLGPALVLSCVFMALYAIARARVPAVVVGLALLVAGFALAYWIGYPSTVRQRVAIWADPWNNGVFGGNQIAHGLWALSTGAFWGSGPGLGSPQSVPAAPTDFVLAAIGEELGFVGLVVVISLYAMLSWRCFRTALRAPGDYSALLATGVALVLVVQAFVIASGMLGLVPLSGVVTPFLSYGRSSMLANCLAVGIVLAIARRKGPVRSHLRTPVKGLALALSIAAVAVVGRIVWIQVVKADRFATASSLTEQADGGHRFEYNPRLVAAARSIQRGTIFDRNGLPLATSTADGIATSEASYRQHGIVPVRDCIDASQRCYPLGGTAFSLIGDWTGQTNWGARNSSYFERDSDATLKGYNDRQVVVEVEEGRTGTKVRTIRRDYSELLPLVRHRYDPDHPAVVRLLDTPRDLRTSIDARLQVRAASALQAGIEDGGHARGAAIVLDVETGEVLASVSYPWPDTTALPAASARRGQDDPLLDRARYGLYPPGSTFKLLVAAAALRSQSPAAESTFSCVRLAGGRVGNFVRGWSRPVRDDPLDTSAHGVVDLRRGLVVSCNAYYAQLALRLGSRPILDAATPFQIDVARPSTAASLQRTLPHAGYGQADVLVSPLKMARVAAAIAGGGLLLPVQWFGSPEVTDEHPQRFLSEHDAALLSRYMREAVTSGTGRALASNPTPIAGKTGTAEVANGKSHSWFVGFAPFGGPRKIAFAVVVENAGYGGRAAAPIAGAVVSAARELGLFQARRSK
jgi:cell division protein FtsW (lipid II flippase)